MSQRVNLNISTTWMQKKKTKNIDSKYKKKKKKKKRWTTSIPKTQHLVEFVLLVDPASWEKLFKQWERTIIQVILLNCFTELQFHFIQICLSKVEIFLWRQNYTFTKKKKEKNSNFSFEKKQKQTQKNSEHFACNSCKEPLGTRNFYETNGSIWCEPCFQEKVCPRCAQCNKAITDR